MISSRRITPAELLAGLDDHRLSTDEVRELLPGMQLPHRTHSWRTQRRHLLGPACQRCHAHTGELVLMPHRMPTPLAQLFTAVAQAWQLARFRQAYYTELTNEQVEAAIDLVSRLGCPNCHIASFKRAQGGGYVCRNRHYFDQPLTHTYYRYTGDDDGDRARSLVRREAALRRVAADFGHYRPALEEEALRQHLQQHLALTQLLSAVTVCRSCHTMATNTKRKFIPFFQPLMPVFSPPPGAPPPL